MYDILECFPSLTILIREICIELECIAIDISFFFALHLLDMIMQNLKSLFVDL
jgi:hypothetical protein